MAGEVIGSAYVEILPKLDRFQAGLRTNLNQTFGGVDRQAQRSATRTERAFLKAGASIKKAFSFQNILVAGGVAAAINSTIQAASDLNETMSKTRVVFGPAADSVVRFGDDAATALGQSRQQALEATATFGNLFVSMRIGQPQAAKMSTTMVQLAADLASFNNSSPEEALIALRAGLVGEIEPLRRFGVNLNEAALKTEVMRLGLGKVGPVLTANQRTQAAYSLILQQTGTAQGDFARTSDQLANQQRILAAEFKDTQAELGKQLLPAMLSAVRFANRLLDGFGRLNQATHGVAAQALLGAGGFLALGVAVAKVVGYVRAARNAWIAYRTATLTAAAADAVLTRQQILLGISTATTGNAAQSAGAKLVTFGAYTAAAAVGVGTLQYNLDQFQRHGLKDGHFLDPASLAIKKAGQQLGFFKDKVDESAGAQQAANDVAAQAKQVQEAYAAALGGVGNAQGAAAAKADELAGKLKKLKQGFREQVESVRDSILSYDGLITKSDVTAKQVIGDLHNQVANFRTYSKDVRRLIREGVSADAIQELSEKGPQFVHALATGTDAQLQVYKRTWRNRQAEIRGSFAESMDLQFAKLKRSIEAMQDKINELSGKTIYITAKASVRINDSVRSYLRAANVPGFHARGARIPGYGGGDIYPAMLEPGETVVPKELTPEIAGWARRKGIPGFQRGGLVGDFDQDLSVVGSRITTATERIGQRFVNRLADLIGQGLSKALEQAIPAFTDHGAGSWKQATALLSRLGIPYGVASTFRPGARTHATGAVSFHARNRAVDLTGPDMLAIFRALVPTNPTELIYSRAPFYIARGGRRPISALNPITKADHFSHVHAAYDRGGWLMPGVTVAENRTGRPERVLGPARDAVGRLVSAGAGGVRVENLIVQPLAGQFRLRDVMTELALQGVR